MQKAAEDTSSVSSYKQRSRWSPYDMDQAAFQVGMSESTATAGGALELSSSTRTDGKKKIINIQITCTCAMFLGSGYSCSVDTSVAT